MAVALTAISGCGVVQKSLTAADLASQNEEATIDKSVSEYIPDHPDTEPKTTEENTEPITASPSAYIPGGIKIGDGTSIIEAVYFDSDHYNELTGGGEYTARPEMEEAGGPQTQCYSDIFAGNIGWTAPGEWVQYTIDVEKTGTYHFAAYLASDIAVSAAGNIEVSYDGTVIGRTYSEDTNGWQNYSSYPVGEINMTAGVHIIKVDFFDGNTNLAALEVTMLSADLESAPEYTESAETTEIIETAQESPLDMTQESAEPMTASPAAYIPGGIKIGDRTSIIEGVYFDGDNYNENSGADNGLYDARPEMKEAGGPQTELNDSGFAGNLAWTNTGEWVQYTIDVEKTGTYNFAAYLASAFVLPENNIEVSYDGVVIGRTYNDDNNGWQVYGLYPIGDVDMTAGVHIIKVEIIEGQPNLAALEVTLIE